MKAVDFKMQETHGFCLEGGKMIGLTNAVSSSEVFSVHCCEAIGYILLTFPVDSKIETFPSYLEASNLYELYIRLKALEAGHGEEYEGFGFKSPRRRVSRFGSSGPSSERSDSLD